jgi:hypothetical protein
MYMLYVELLLQCGVLCVTITKCLVDTRGEVCARSIGKTNTTSAIQSSITRSSTSAGLVFEGLGIGTMVGVRV